MLFFNISHRSCNIYKELRGMTPFLVLLGLV